MNNRILLAAATVAALGLAASAFAAPAFAATPDATKNCFLAHEWQDWKAPNDKTIYVRVNQHDVWQLDLSGRSNMITDDTNHLITNLQDSAWICQPIDLSNMKISNGSVSEPLFVKSLTRLTPEQVAAIPQKDRP
jgi:hypothetical protein